MALSRTQQFFLPAVAAVVTALVLAGRFEPWVAAAAAVAGLAGAAAYPFVDADRRAALAVFILLPVIAWVASRPPWGALATAIIFAGAIVILIGDLPRFQFEWPAVLPLGAGIVGAIVTGVLAGQFGLLPTPGHGVALVLLLGTARMLSVFVASTHGAYSIAVALSSAPMWSGLPGLALGVSEAAFGLSTLGSPVRHRLAWMMGAPFALVGLF